MKNLNCGLRNGLRGRCERVSSPSPVENTGWHYKNPTGWKTENLRRAPGVETSTVVTKRGRGWQVDGALGIGHPDMPAEHITRGLACIIQRGVRTSTVRELGGVSVVLCPEIPAGTFALRTAGRITAYQIGTGVPIVSLECEGA